MSKQKLAVVLSFLLCLVGCTTPKTHLVEVDSELLYLDDDYQYETYKLGVESEKEIFSLNKEMKRLVYKELLSEENYAERAKKIVSYIFDNDYLGISYDNDANLTASQTFENKSANCLSLTIMAYSLARASRLNVSFQEVDIPEYWERNGNYTTLTGHVNLLVKEPFSANDYVYKAKGKKIVEIDFNLANDVKNYPRNRLSKNEILSLFYNNKAAQALIHGEYNKAYAYSKNATIQNPLNAAAWSNLGILYKFSGRYQLAEQAYSRAIDLDPKNLTAQVNLANIYLIYGKKEQANQILQDVNAKRRDNPYYKAMLAMEAYHDGDFKSTLR